MRALAIVVALAACGDHNVERGTEVVAVPTVTTNKLDLLFVLGNEVSTQGHHVALTNAFPALLAQLSIDGRPDLHVGAITPDLGTQTAGGTQGPNIAGSVGSCLDRGGDGALVRLDGTAGTLYLIDSATETNHPGTLAADLHAITGVGSAGCGFQQPLAAIRASFSNASNAGFRRDDAALAIVVLADEDDCSALDPDLFSSDTATLGALFHYRCVQFGYTCAEHDMTTPGPRTSCVPDAGSTVVEDPADFLPAIRDRAVDPRRVAFGAILAPADVAVTLVGNKPSLAASCTWTDASNAAEVAEPAIRIAWLTNQFEDRGAIGSICDEDLAPAMTMMGINARRAMGDPCVEDDVDLSHCTAVEEVDGIETPLVACASPTQTDCYELAIDTTSCPNAANRKLVVHRNTATPAGYDLLRCVY